MSGRAGSSGGALRGLAGPKAEKVVSLALQGGGAHGAFTWGVLDAILEDERLAIEAGCRPNPRPRLSVGHS